MFPKQREAESKAGEAESKPEEAESKDFPSANRAFSRVCAEIQDKKFSPAFLKHTQLASYSAARAVQAASAGDQRRWVLSHVIHGDRDPSATLHFPPGTV